MKLVFDANGENYPEIRVVAREDAEKVTGLSAREFSGEADSLCLFRENGAVAAWTGLGRRSGVGEGAVRRACAVAARALAANGCRKMAVGLGDYGDFAKAAVEGVGMGAYRFNAYKTKDRVETGIEVLRMEGLGERAREQALRGAAIAGAVNRVRDYGNRPPNLLTPDKVAEIAETYLRLTGATMTVFDDFELKEKGFGGHVAVGAGSVNPPRLIVLEREVDPSWPTVALVGKTITFDSGGLSLKGAKDLYEEKWDKMGGMAALGVLEVVRDLAIPVNLVVALCAAENMPGPGAFRPGDVINVFGGTSVEIMDTDAEGRLVLADALAYVAEKFKPSLTIDIGTLTGACCVALGMERTGLFAEDDGLAELFYKAGEASGDRCWRLPLGEDFERDLESRVADVRNCGLSRNGGASKAAMFLRRFKGDGSWVHLDIAGTGMPDEDYPYQERGASGAGVRLVAEALFRLYPVA
jgi:leucyl aminopeptidase